MRCLIIGAEGQLGRALQATAPPDATVFAYSKAQCDLSNFAHVRATIEKVRPNLVFNAAAYTAVDAAETNLETAMRINATSVGHLAEAAKSAGARLVHTSTDYVFNGQASVPYAPDDKTGPINVYGHSKLEGERAISETDADALIVRTSWVYAEQGNNFVRTMLRFMNERDELRVINDQIGTPTYARNLAVALWSLSSMSGIFHYTDSGVASWYDFAVAIQDEALDIGLLKKTARIIPIPTSQYPTPAKRPKFGILDKSKTLSALGKPGPHWRHALRECLRKVTLDV